MNAASIARESRSLIASSSADGLLSQSRTPTRARSIRPISGGLVEGTEDVRAQVGTGDLAFSRELDGGAVLGGDTSPGLPVAHDVLALTDGGGQFGHPAHDLDGSIECAHSDIITFRDSKVNTYRVRRVSRNVKDGWMDFPTALRTARKAARLTQEQLGLAIGAGQSRIGNYESGTREPSLDELKQLANALGTSCDALLGMRWPESQSGRLDDVTMTQAVELLHLMGDLRPEDARLRRMTWPLIKMAASAVARATDQREAVAAILTGLEGVDA